MKDDLKGYPDEIFEFEDDDYLNFCLNGATLDLEHFRMLKIGENGEVLRGFNGFQRMTEAEIIELYGPEKNFKIDVQKYRNLPSYASFHTYFDCPIVLLLLKFMEMKRLGKVTKTPLEMFDDLKTVIINNYVNYNREEVFPIETYGNFFPRMCAEPSKYIQKRDDFKELLISLKKKGKFLFLSTNSHVDYCELIMTASIGEDWKDYFDVISAASSKPVFWKDFTATPGSPTRFTEVDKSIPNYEG